MPVRCYSVLFINTYWWLLLNGGYELMMQSLTDYPSVAPAVYSAVVILHSSCYTAQCSMASHSTSAMCHTEKHKTNKDQSKWYEQSTTLPISTRNTSRLFLLFPYISCFCSIPKPALNVLTRPVTSPASGGRLPWFDLYSRSHTYICLFYHI